jgi:dTDP-D-glucose 4,6-dehydratase
MEIDVSLVVALITAIAMIIREVVAKKQSKLDSTAKELNVHKQLMDMADDRLRREVQIEVAMADLREEIEARHDRKLEREIRKLKASYDDKFERLKQAHKDQVTALKKRIKELESHL